ncbi:ADL336Cp [Eremothecium gossypii ATCC 10895]|uniref:ADL336Cp n=1 Tax=Eremothecium gossypii (strain ATCC 10895 / CBS 109.51 / FGSC 9923 / NRRL Y-1056) TaxID=284811 RepID=Q75BA2_EREGS|nr:ADL336Cp [Eremothecium gossypii ATCC 10895]AAS51584.2 ADL336Cp [Eremothecium gossypii ATCC 10895]
MGTDAIKKGLAAAGRSTIDGAVAVSKKGIKASKTHYEKSKAMRGGKSASSSAGTSSQSYETQTRLAQLPDPRQFPPPPLRPEQRPQSGSAGAIGGSTGSSVSSAAVSAGRASAVAAVVAPAALAVRTGPGFASAMDTAQGALNPAQPAVVPPVHGSAVSGRSGNGNAPNISMPVHRPLPMRPDSGAPGAQLAINAPHVAPMHQNTPSYAIQGYSDYGMQERGATQGAVSTEPAPPPIPVRNYETAAAPAANPSRLPLELPPYPLMPCDDASYSTGMGAQPAPSQLLPWPHVPGANASDGIIAPGQSASVGQAAPAILPSRPQVPGSDFGSQPVQEITTTSTSQHQIQVKPYTWGAPKGDREANKINVPQVEINVLPPPPKHRDRDRSKSSTPAHIQQSTTGPKPSIPARRSPSAFASPATTGSGAGGPPSDQLETKCTQQTGHMQSASTSFSSLPQTSPRNEGVASIAKTREESIGPTKGISGQYNYEISVSFEPPPKPHRRGDGPQSRASPFASSRDNSTSVPDSAGSPSRGSIRHSALNNTDPPPPYTDTAHARAGSDSPAPSASKQRSSAGRSLPPLSADRSLPPPARQAAGAMASRLSEEASGVTLRRITSPEGSQTGDGASVKKKPPIVPKKKESLAGNKKAPPPVPKKKAILAQGLQRDAATSSDAAEVLSSSGIDTSAQDDNPFRRYLKNVVPQENDRVHHR